MDTAIVVFTRPPAPAATTAAPAPGRLIPAG
jgi:hypothetical protein